MTNHNLVQVSDGRLVTTSLLIAQNFGKKHKHVLESINSLECSQEFGETNFRLSSYISNQNKELPMYEITRDGFVFLCMGFTGATAATWKERYINAFNQMENHIIANYTQLETLKAAYLQANPDAKKLLRYVHMSLNHVEIGKLLNVSSSTVRDRLKKLARLGLCDYQPDAAASQRCKLAHAKMMQIKQAQLDLED